MDADTLSAGRHLYVGASEVGGCPRFVSWSKATARVWIPDADSAGVMLPGRLVENEGVQLLRLMGLDSALSATGTRQANLRDENSGLGCHPDGFLSADAFELDELSTYFTEDGGPWKLEELRPLLVGPGIVEFKSGSSAVFRETVRHGVSLQYADQTQVNMGLSGRHWTLLVMICRDNLSKIALVFIPFREARFRALQLHANAILGSAALAREALEGARLWRVAEDDPEDEKVIATVAMHLLAPDEARGYCRKCPLASSCPALTRRTDDAFFPEGILPEVEALAEIAAAAGDTEKAAKEEADDAKDRLKELAEQYGATRAMLSPPFTTLSVGTTQGRESCDLQRLKTLYPAAFADCVSRGEDFKTVRINRKKGAKS
jgi:hypothetical protein